MQMIDQSALRGMQVSCFSAMVGAQAVRRDLRRVCAGLAQDWCRTCAGLAQDLRRTATGLGQDLTCCLLVGGRWLCV